MAYWLAGWLAYEIASKIALLALASKLEAAHSAEVQSAPAQAAAASFTQLRVSNQGEARRSHYHHHRARVRAVEGKVGRLSPPKEEMENVAATVNSDSGNN